MPRLFVGNFDFEHRVAYGNGSLPRGVERINAELAPVWTTIAEPGDAVWTPAPIDPAVFERLVDRGLPRVRPIADPQTLPRDTELVFWGENEWSRAAATRWDVRHVECDPAVVRRVNSRRFKFALERRFGVDLPSSALVESAAELASAVESLSSGSGWVLKSEFGGAGREVRFGTGSLTVADAAWAGNRFRRRLAVTVEPRLERIDEAGIQFRIDSDREIVFDGVTPLLTRPGGGYLGSRFDDDPSLGVIWSEAIEVGRRVAEAAAAEGYFGPLGIDTMRHRGADGTVRVRPLQDLNARYTMGRLALGLRRFPAFAGAFRIEEFRARLAATSGSAIAIPEGSG